jgi:Lrp/AsnC family leucine-responsive transcriptional regulator
MRTERTIDAIDCQILDVLQENARTTNAEIARRVGMAPSAIFERVRKLEEQGVIQGYGARLDPHALELDTLAFVLVRVDERLGESLSGERLREVPGVLEVHHIAGEDCYLLKVRTRDTDALGLLLRERIGAIESVRSTRTTIVLGTVKESASLPLGASPSLDGGRARLPVSPGHLNDGAGRRQAPRRARKGRAGPGGRRRSAP